MKLFRLLPLLLLPVTGAAEDVTLPDPPEGQVLDQSGWLSEQDASRLESELSRLRVDHHVDVMVVIWDGPLPSDSDRDAFARRLGQTWANEKLWAVVLQVPGAIDRPGIAHKAAAIDSLHQEESAKTIQTAVARGMKEWSDQSRVRGVALNLAEELVYLQLHHQREPDAVQPAKDEAPALAQGRQIPRTIRIALGVAAAVLITALLLAIRMFGRRRGPEQLDFPETRWRRRLGAPWCGGSDLVTTFHPPAPR
jgi:hypothetical protein